VAQMAHIAGEFDGLGLGLGLAVALQLALFAEHTEARGAVAEACAVVGDGVGLVSAVVVGTSAVDEQELLAGARRGVLLACFAAPLCRSERADVSVSEDAVAKEVMSRWLAACGAGWPERRPALPIIRTRDGADLSTAKDVVWELISSLGHDHVDVDAIRRSGTASHLTHFLHSPLAPLGDEERVCVWSAVHRLTSHHHCFCSFQCSGSFCRSFTASDGDHGLWPLDNTW
jgi:hypothetical protein